MISLRYGTTRTVLLIGCWAVKIPAFTEWRLFLQGLLANMQEATFSRAGWPQLCPVLWSLPGGWLVVMRRTEPLTREQFLGLDYAEWIKRGEDLPTGEWVIPVENKQDSFGHLDGVIVAVDYGN
jgi:hypothetical protein